MVSRKTFFAEIEVFRQENGHVIYCLNSYIIRVYTVEIGRGQKKQKKGHQKFSQIFPKKRSLKNLVSDRSFPSPPMPACYQKSAALPMICPAHGSSYIYIVGYADFLVKVQIVLNLCDHCGHCCV